MARMPGATWRPISINYSSGGMGTIHGVVLHIMQGTLDGSDSWFRNPAAQASAHFGVGKDGRIFQWVDTANKAWHCAGGNSQWIGIEHEGNSGQSLTAAQLAATARVVAWASKTHGIPLQSTDSTSGRGIGWHGMGGGAWGGHYDCPGNPIKGQRGAIITAAKGGGTKEDDVPETVSVGTKAAVKLTAGKKTRVKFDKEYDDPGKMHADGTYPAILSRPCKATTEVTVSGTSGTAELVAHNMKTGEEKSLGVHPMGYPFTALTNMYTDEHLYLDLTSDKDVSVHPYAKSNYVEA